MTVQTLRLVTNLCRVKPGLSDRLEFHCHALLLEVPIRFGKPYAPGRIRGFYADGNMPVFDYLLNCGPLEYEVSPANSDVGIKVLDGNMQPLSVANKMVFKDGTELLLMSDNWDAGLQEKDYADLSLLWKELPLRVLEHWPNKTFPVRHSLLREQVPRYLESYSG